MSTLHSVYSGQLIFYIDNLEVLNDDFSSGKRGGCNYMTKAEFIKLEIYYSTVFNTDNSINICDIHAIICELKSGRM